MTPTQPPGLRADEREALKPCPFCGGRPILTVRPDNANATAYFAAVACFCGGYASCAHKDAIAIEPADAEAKAIAAWNARAALTTQPATSEERDGLVQRLRDSSRDEALTIGAAWNLLEEAADALAQPAAPVTPTEQIKVARAEGRGEALALILQLDAEEGLDDFTASRPIGDTGDFSCEWDEQKLREWLSADDRAWSLICNFEAVYWDRLGLRDDAKALVKKLRDRLAASQPPASEPAGQQAAEGEPSKVMSWEGAEEWMPLAWELCAEECGEEACTELVWEGGPIPEPWGDRWLKYEDEAKRLIALVRKCVPATQPAEPSPSDAELDSSTAAERDELLDFIYEHGTVSEGVLRLIRKVQRATLAKHGAGKAGK